MTRLASLAALSLVSLCACGGEGARTLVINEVLTRNRFATLDENENRSPWIELLNNGSSAVSLGDYALSDDPTAPMKWPLPDLTLGPSDYFLVWCSGRSGLSTVENAFHTNCEVGVEGQSLLIARRGELVDAVVLPPSTEDRSYARSPDGTGEFLYHLRPTPWSRNEGAVSRNAIPTEPRLTPGAGRYRTSLDVDVAIDIPVENRSIRYTLDGSPPTATSEPYVDAVRLERAPFWPGVILRAAVFSGPSRVSQIATASYFLNAETYELPILSIAMDPSVFRSVHYDETGRGRESEREGFLEVFDPEGRRQVATAMGLRLHGQTSRHGVGTQRKSYRVYFRDEYGSGKLRYPLIADAGVPGLDRFVLRANNDDGLRNHDRATYVRDELLRELHEDMGALVAHGDWYNLFVNMDYRGVYNVAERIDGDFFESHLPQQRASWDVIHDGEVVEGDRETWEDLAATLRDRETSYETLASVVDIESYTRYMILNIWAQNHDWPHKNFFAARPRAAGSRWIFLGWDAEMTLGLYPETYDADTFDRALTRSGSVLADLFPVLMAFEEYRQYFRDELDRALETTLSPEHVLERFARLRHAVEGDLKRDIARRFSPRHAEMWEANCRDIETFIRNRGAILRGYVTGSALYRPAGS